MGTDGGEYRVYITGLGSVEKSDVIDLLEDVLGYTTASAKNLASNIPVQIAGNLSLKQAAVVLATLGTVNRLRSIVKPRKPSLLQRLFHSLFSVNRRRKPVHVRRRIRPRSLSFGHVEPQRRVVRQQLRPFGNSFNVKPVNANHKSKPGGSGNPQSYGGSQGHGSHQGHGHGGRK